MTLDELSTYYAKLLILQYVEKPKAFAMVKTLVTPLLMDQLPLAVQDAFNLSSAEGVQLDVLGKYIGVSRVGYTLTGPITLGDSDFRTLMQMVLIKNNSGSSLATIQSLLAASFPGQVFISDNQTMAINYVLVESLGTADLLEILTIGGYLPSPMGVATSVTVVPVHDNPFFGFRTYSAPDLTVSPFNNYEFYQITYPWFSYQEA